MAKILITSDIHLGAGGETIVPEAERIETFKQIAGLACEHDLMLIAGDLIDSGDVSDEIKDIIKEEFRKIREAGTEIVYTPGISEQSKVGGIYDFIGDFGATHIFNRRKISAPYSLTADGQRLHIYGAVSSPHFNITNVKRRDEQGFHIGLFHSDFDFKKNKPGIRIMELDFYALGYGHSCKIFKVLDRVIGVKPGSPVAITEKETGERYVLSVTVAGDAVSEIKHIPVNTVSVSAAKIDCGDYADSNALRDALMDKASDKTILVLSIEGEHSFTLSSVLESLKEHFFDLRVTDNSIPSADFLITSYAEENSIRGEFFRILQEKLSEKQTDKAILACLPQLLRFIMDDELKAMEEWLCAL
ncbi:MAG: metallophosphoesterase [Spirochaetia bacterium]|jgi:DNA repair exonuclease SbcCD nuclease subunit|nr:metallophosphoesterase [Spirochaetia bacterium]